MKKYQPKNIVEFYGQHNFRLMIIAILCGLLILILGGRMYYLQVSEYNSFKTKSDKNRIQVKFVSSIRGNIYDREGTILAGNSLSYNLGVIVEHANGLEKTLEKIDKLISISKNDLEKFKLNRKYTRRYEPVILKTRLTEQEVAKIEVNSYHISGLVIVTQYDRYYSFAEQFAHVLGHVGRINQKELREVDINNYQLTSKIGKIGVEKQYEKILHGSAGSLKIETDAQGRILRTLSKNNSLAGTDIYLTIDSRLQKYAYELMKEKRAALVAIDPNTFDILAMVSTPSYNSGLFVNGISHKDYNKLLSSIDKPLFHRSLSGRYPAGSTFKPFLALAGLESNTINKKNRINCIGHYQLKNSEHRFRDWKEGGHGWTNVEKAIAESCDVYFFDLAFKLGIDKIHPYLTLFGFGQKTNIDLPYEVEGFIPSREWKQKRRNSNWLQGETLNVGIGQGMVQITPLQLAFATATLANRGKSYNPKLLHRKKRINDVFKFQELGDSKQIKIKEIKNWNTIIKGMKSVVHSEYGTARNISGSRYKIAGKTGTAQVITIAQDETYDEAELDERKHDHALFIAFAPADDPKIAIAVIVENGKHGNTVAAPIASKVINKYLTKILPTRSKTLDNYKQSNNNDE